jgi:hypothetical protein
MAGERSEDLLDRPAERQLEHHRDVAEPPPLDDHPRPRFGRVDREAHFFAEFPDGDTRRVGYSDRPDVTLVRVEVAAG